jgi:hypothetical protein
VSRWKISELRPWSSGMQPHSSGLGCVRLLVGKQPHEPLPLLTCVSALSLMYRGIHQISPSKESDQRQPAHQRQDKNERCAEERTNHYMIASKPRRCVLSLCSGHPCCSFLYIGLGYGQVSMANHASVQLFQPKLAKLPWQQLRVCKTIASARTSTNATSRCAVDLVMLGESI